MARLVRATGRYKIRDRVARTSRAMTTKRGSRDIGSGLDKAIPSGGPIDTDIAARTDSYFTRTRKIVERFGDMRVTYAIFLRRPAICAPRLMAEWIAAAARERGIEAELTLTHEEGAWVGAGEPL